MRNSNTILDNIIKYFSCQNNSLLNRPEIVLSTIYVLTKVSKMNNPLDVDFENVINSDDELLSLAASRIDTKTFVELSFLLKNYKSDDFVQSFNKYLESNELNSLRSEYGAQTSKTVASIVTRILDINSEDKLLDIGSGCGNLILSDGALSVKQSVGIDLIANQCLIANMRADLINSKSKFIEGDYFLTFEHLAKQQFNKIVCHFPWAVKDESGREQKFLETYYKSEIDSNKLTNRSSDWNVCLSIAKLLNDNSKAVVIGYSSMLFRATEHLSRKYLLESGFIESIITLPKNLLTNTAIEPVLIVLSKNNQKVRVVDASNFETTKEKDLTTLSDIEIAHIIELLGKNDKYSKSLSMEDLEKNNFVINNKIIFDEQSDFVENGVLFKDVILNIKRGISITASQLDKMISSADTNVKYLPVAAVTDGFIDDNLPNISPDDKLSKNYIKNNSLVLTRMANPLKTAVITVNDGENVVPNGNLFVIELDETKVDPYYVKAFLDSKKGRKSLERLCVGAVIPMLSASSLNDLVIPLPTLDKQKKISSRVCETISRIQNLKQELKNSVLKLSEIFENEE